MLEGVPARQKAEEVDAFASTPKAARPTAEVCCRGLVTCG